MEKTYPRAGWRGRRCPVHALKPTTLRLAQGEALGIVGESGSGKSTLARIFAGLTAPSAGEVRFRGRALSGWLRKEKREFHRSVQMVFQDPLSSLNPRKTVARILDDPLRNLTGLDRAARRQRINELLDLTRLPPDCLKRHPHEFSGGQAQRIAIARALAPQPGVIIMDEPVSALDVSVQAQILNLLKALQAQLNLTYFFVSHDLAVVEYLCPRIVVMQAGDIVEQGTRDAILRKPQSPYCRKLIESHYSL